MDDDRLATRVGGATLVGAAALVALILLLGNRHLRPGMRLVVEIARVGALRPGAPLRLAGLELGTVEDIALAPRPSGRPVARLDLWVDRRRAWLLTETTDFFLSQQGLLGETYLEIAARPGPPGAPLADGAVVQAVEPPPIDELLATSYRNLEAVNALFRDGLPELAALRRALAGLEETLATVEPAPGALAAAWAAGRRLAGETVGLEGPPGRDLRADAAALAAALPSLSARVARLSAALAPLAARAGDPRLVRLAAALDRAAPLLAELERARRAAAELAAMVSAGQGTLGALLRDVELADEMKQMSRTLKREPWRALGHE